MLSDIKVGLQKEVKINELVSKTNEKINHKLPKREKIVKDILRHKHEVLNKLRMHKKLIEKNIVKYDKQVK